MRYELVRRLSLTAMSEVWAARTPEGTHVALKRVSSQADPALRRMLRDEARIAAALAHPALVRVIESGGDAHGEFVVYELVDGIDCERMIRMARPRIPWTTSAACAIAAEVARVLDYVHGATDHDGRLLEVVHRDVSPSNVLLAIDGSVKLTDFGIARARDRLEKTASGVVKGKAGYCAPEEALGRDVGPPADVWALGSLLHALLTGSSPIRDWIDLHRAVRGQLRLEIADEPLRALVRACLEIDPAARPSALEVSSRLRDRVDAGARAELASVVSSAKAQASGSLDDVIMVSTQTDAFIVLDAAEASDDH